jgi:DNA-binding NarL/FixJ family response regulator
MVLRVVIAEDSFLMREGIATVIGLDDDLELVAACESFESFS